MLTWATEDAYELRRASAIITNRDDVAQGAPLVFPDRLEDIDQVVCCASSRKDNNAFGLDSTFGGWCRGTVVQSK